MELPRGHLKNGKRQVLDDSLEKSATATTKWASTVGKVFHPRLSGVTPPWELLVQGGERPHGVRDTISEKQVNEQVMSGRVS